MNGFLHRPQSTLTRLRPKINFLSVGVGLFFVMTIALNAEFADSIYLDYQNGLTKTGDTLLTDMSVEETAISTYYAAITWDDGYMGLQRGGSGYFKHVHYSIWDPPNGGVADLVWNDADVVAQRFGGEGTGWKVMWPFSWNEATSYRFCVKLSNTGTNTDYDAYFLDPTSGAWKHLATLRRHDGPHSFSYTSSFVEDFGGTLDLRRSALFGNGWLRTFSNTWVELQTAKFATATNTHTNKDADVVGTMFRLETGGATTNDTPLNTTLTRMAEGRNPDDLNVAINQDTSNIQLNWQTLPFRSYEVQWTDDLTSWPFLQNASVVSNRWSQSIQGTPQRFFRIHSTE